MSNDECFSAEELFASANKYMLGLMSNESEFDDSFVDKTVQRLEQCAIIVHETALFSKNEEIDEIQTGYLKYLFLDFYFGKCYLQYKDQKMRKLRLYEAKEYLLKYLTILNQFHLLHESETLVFEGKDNGLSADAKRLYKIDKYKREKAGKERISELQRLLHITRGDTSVDHEEEMRELVVAQLQSYGRDALDELSLISQELTMLQFQSQLEESAEQDDRERARQGSEKHNNNNSMSLAQAYATPVENKGISITKTFKVGDQLMMSREVVHSSVFGSNIAPPTMSLEEFGDLQLKDAQERGAAQQNTEAGPRRYKQLWEEGDEDDADLVDESAYHDRAWDDWKDSNKKGSGNKMGKRF